MFRVQFKLQWLPPCLSKSSAGWTKLLGSLQSFMLGYVCYQGFLFCYEYYVQAEEAEPMLKLFKNQWATEFLTHQLFGTQCSYSATKSNPNTYHGHKAQACLWLQATSIHSSDGEGNKDGTSDNSSEGSSGGSATECCSNSPPVGIPRGCPALPLPSDINDSASNDQPPEEVP